VRAANSRTPVLRYQPINLARRVIWSVFALILILAPLVFNKGASLSILCQMGTVMIFGLSYNMLLGQGGMLSFGHAVYSGLGGYFAVHAMNLAAAGQAPIPVSLIPLVGGVAGMGFGILFGYVTTRKAGTTFAMITLGMVELVFACSLMFPGFFGGEGGITTNRVMGSRPFGISYGPQIQVYYLIAFWLFVSTIAMYAYTHTPLGRIMNAVRDNPERAEFIGYDPRWVRYLTLILSAFFAGISGALAAINFEIATAENVSTLRSGAILLFTFIGGVGFFFGPMIGAVIGVFLTVLLSEYTKAWLLYLGVFFILIVMYAPGGVASIIMMNLRLLKFGRYAQVWKPLLALCASALLAFAGCALVIEMFYHLSLDAVQGMHTKLAGIPLQVSSVQPWLAAALLLGGGGWWFARARAVFRRAWDTANEEVEDMIRRAQT